MTVCFYCRLQARTLSVTASYVFPQPLLRGLEWVPRVVKCLAWMQLTQNLTGHVSPPLSWVLRDPLHRRPARTWLWCLGEWNKGLLVWQGFVPVPRWYRLLWVTLAQRGQTKIQGKGWDWPPGECPVTASRALCLTAPKPGTWRDSCRPAVEGERSFSVTSRGLKPTENSGSTTPGPVLLAEEPGVGCRLARGRSRRRERTSSGGLVTSSRAGMLGSPVGRAGEGLMEGRERLPSWNPGAANPLWAWYPPPAAPASLRENGTN